MDHPIPQKRHNHPKKSIEALWQYIPELDSTASLIQQLSSIPKARQSLNDDLALIRTSVLHFQNQVRHYSEDHRKTIGRHNSNKSWDIVGRVL